MALLSGCAADRGVTSDGAFLALRPLADAAENAVLDHAEATPAPVIEAVERLTAGVYALHK